MAFAPGSDVRLSGQPGHLEVDRVERRVKIRTGARQYGSIEDGLAGLPARIERNQAVSAGDAARYQGERDSAEVDLRDATGAALRATSLWADDPRQASRRAIYTAGTIGDRAVPSYVDEDGVDPARHTETLAELTCEVRNARWQGVPFTLRSGKALAARDAEIILRFRPVRHLPAGFSGEAPGSVLRFTLGPDRMSLELNVNGADDPFRLEKTTLTAELGEGALKAYGEVLSGILDGDATLSVRGDAAEQCWRIVQPAIDAWRDGTVPLDEYAAGSTGPESWASLD